MPQGSTVTKSPLEARRLLSQADAMTNDTSKHGKQVPKAGHTLQESRHVLGIHLADVYGQRTPYFSMNARQLLAAFVHAVRVPIKLVLAIVLAGFRSASSSSSRSL